MEDIKIMLN